MSDLADILCRLAARQALARSDFDNACQELLRSPDGKLVDLKESARAEAIRVAHNILDDPPDRDALAVNPDLFFRFLIALIVASQPSAIEETFQAASALKEISRERQAARDQTQREAKAKKGAATRNADLMRRRNHALSAIRELVAVKHEKGVRSRERIREAIADAFPDEFKNQRQVRDWLNLRKVPPFF